MSKPTSRANGCKPVVRSKVKHFFRHQKNRMGLVIRTIGLARGKPAITMANMVYNMGRLRWLRSQGAPPDANQNDLKVPHQRTHQYFLCGDLILSSGLSKMSIFSGTVITRAAAEDQAAAFR
ncbi:hypothetical protein J4E08_07645 [Sagittula sp. NFXS13]|uniref:hypothetical protein n=1 Tax=Sagittula sp. NFXS13 TaxID=2819095 RepID=UPI0032DE9C3E